MDQDKLREREHVTAAKPWGGGEAATGASWAGQKDTDGGLLGERGCGSWRLFPQWNGRRSGKQWGGKTERLGEAWRSPLRGPQSRRGEALGQGQWSPAREGGGFLWLRLTAWE